MTIFNTVIPILIFNFNLSYLALQASSKLYNQQSEEQIRRVFDDNWRIILSFLHKNMYPQHVFMEK